MRRVKYCALALVVVSAFAGPAARAQSAGDDYIAQRLQEIERLRQQLAQREQAVRGDISSASSQRDVLTSQLRGLQSQLAEVQGRVEVAAGIFNGLQKRIDAADARLKRGERELESRLIDLRSRAVQVYKHGPISLVDMVLDAKGLTDLVRRFAYAMNIVRTDDHRIRSIHRDKVRIMRQRAAIAKLRDRAAAQLAVVTAERNRAAAITQGVAAKRDAAAGDLETSIQELGNIQAARQKYDQETAVLQAESAAIAAFLRGHGGGKATVSPKGMVWPVSGPVTSGFGWRTHPIFGTKRFHSGIDIGAPSGATVTAAATGMVIFVGSKGGYGNTMIVDHGGGIATLYGHLSSFIVGQGQAVARGQPIAHVGCTGYCTGPHLHFEVRVNGDPVDPMGWLP